MKRRTLALITALTLISTGQAFAANSLIYSSGMLKKIAIGGYDPVAYILRQQAYKGDKRYQTKWRCATWEFRSQKNLNLFRKNPEKYAPQYGGYCAYAMAQKNGMFVKTDPHAFTVYQHKLYLNLNKKVRKSWLTKKDQNIAAADKNWQTHQTDGSITACKGR
jgi:hypothetical protein